MKTQKISPESGIKILKRGASLLQSGIDCNQINYIGDGIYHYEGIRDQAPTVMNENETMDLISRHKWVAEII